MMVAHSRNDLDLLMFYGEFATCYHARVGLEIKKKADDRFGWLIFRNFSHLQVY